MYINRMVLGLMSLDKAGIRLNEMIEEVDSLYYCSGYIDDPLDDNPKKKRKLPVFVPKFMNDFTNVDYVRGMIEQRVRDGSSLEEDELYTTLSGVKVRGRKKKSAVELVYNPIETIVSEYIKAKKNENTSNTNGGKTTAAAAIDLYPAFHRCIEILNQSIPRESNHGWFMASIYDYNRYLTNEDFPSHGLLSTINNMFCCVSHRKMTMSFNREIKRYYCAMTGEEIMNGEEVYRLLFIERDSEREKEWVDFKIVEPRVFESEKMTKSIRVYLIKMQSNVLPITLFPKKRRRQPLSEMDEDEKTMKKKRKIDFKPKKKEKEFTPHGREYVRRTILNLLKSIERHPSPERLCHNNMKFYTVEKERIEKICSMITETNFRTVFDKLLLYVILSSPQEKNEKPDTRKLRYNKNRLIEAVIDFTLVMGPTTTSHPVIRELFKLSEMKKRPSINRFISFIEWEPYFKEHILFFLTIADLMGMGGGSGGDDRNVVTLLEEFNIKLHEEI